ncbi:MAG: hypothetical protein V1898_03100 [Patescibacteria group bacterium]
MVEPIKPITPAGLYPDVHRKPKSPVDKEADPQSSIAPEPGVQVHISEEAREILRQRQEELTETDRQFPLGATIEARGSRFLISRRASHNAGGEVVLTARRKIVEGTFSGTAMHHETIPASQAIFIEI